MHLEFSYNKEEVLHALRYHFLQRGEIKVFKNTLFILLVFTLCGFAYQLVTFGALIGIVDVGVDWPGVLVYAAGVDL